VRSGFMRFGLWTSALTFFVLEGYFLLDQLEIGYASAVFMLGTAFLIAGFCIGLFAIIVAIGLAISAAFSDEPPHHQSQEPSGSTGPINPHGNPRTYAVVKPNAPRHLLGGWLKRPHRRKLAQRPSGAGKPERTTAHR
jgi:hypothetical protein